MAFRYSNPTIYGGFWETTLQDFVLVFLVSVDTCHDAFFGARSYPKERDAVLDATLPVEECDCQANTAVGVHRLHTAYSFERGQRSICPSNSPFA